MTAEIAPPVADSCDSRLALELLAAMMCVTDRERKGERGMLTQRKLLLHL